MDTIVAGSRSGIKRHDDETLYDQRHEFESVGEILARLRRERRTLEARMGMTFDAALSLRLDALLVQEEAVCATVEEGQP